METIRIFSGFDNREEIGYHVFCSSIIHGTSLPVSITPLVKEKLDAADWHESGGRRKALPVGSNAFTFSRFLVPWLMDYRGWALFLDGVDMIVLGDLAELWRLRDSTKAVQVVKHDYRTQHQRKYVGTRMECDNADYERKNWASVAIINCSHRDWDAMDPERVARTAPMELLQLRFIPDDDIGELPIEWNWLPDEHGPNSNARILHFTAGCPDIPHYRNSPQSGQWFAARDQAMASMGD